MVICRERSGPARIPPPSFMPRKPRRREQPLDRLSKVLSIDLDELHTIRIGVNQRTDEGRLVLRNFVFAISDLDFPLSSSPDMRKAFSSGAQPSDPI